MQGEARGEGGGQGAGGVVVDGQEQGLLWVCGGVHGWGVWLWVCTWVRGVGVYMGGVWVGGWEGWSQYFGTCTQTRESNRKTTRPLSSLFLTLPSLRLRVLV